MEYAITIHPYTTSQSYPVKTAIVKDMGDLTRLVIGSGISLAYKIRHSNDQNAFVQTFNLLIPTKEMHDLQVLFISTKEPVIVEVKIHPYP